MSKPQAQWAGALLFLSGSLKTGLSMEQALENLMREAPEPLRSELARTWDGLKNQNVEKRIERLLEGPSLSLARAALLLSHRAGGQAGRLLEVSAEQLQEKIEMEEKIKALTAQSVASAWITGLSPFGLLVLLWVFAPDYVAPLFNTRAGAAVLLLSIILIVAGLTLVRKMSRVEL